MVKKRPVEILRSALCHVAQGVSLCILELSPGTDLPQTHPSKTQATLGDPWSVQEQLLTQLGMQDTGLSHDGSQR